MEFRLKCMAPRLGETDFVFVNLAGREFDPVEISKAWTRFLKANGLPKRKFHALRHTNASLLIAAGDDILTVSRRLGHATASMTLDVYGHLIGGNDKAAAEAIAKALK